VLTGSEQADLSRTRCRPDVCLVNAIAPRPVTASLQCHGGSRESARLLRRKSSRAKVPATASRRSGRQALLLQPWRTSSPMTYETSSAASDLSPAWLG
jgi:hypothetical protein